MCNKLTSKNNANLPEIKMKPETEAQSEAALIGVEASQYFLQDGRQGLRARWEGSRNTGSGIKLGAPSLSASNT